MSEATITPEYGIFSPPAPLPNPADLSNGQHGANLRYGVVDLAGDEGRKRFSQLLGWFRTFGAPVDSYTFFVPLNASGDGSSGFGSTQIIFQDAKGRRLPMDATQMFNMPEVAMQSLAIAFDLPFVAGMGTFPGFQKIEEAQHDPVGEPIPAMNTPGWSRGFSRYYGVSSDFSGAEYPLGSHFLRIATDEEFVRDQKMFGFKPNPAGFGMIVDLRPVWERIR